ncbi:SHOCT domain-containing protein [Halosimplex sp. J119]
MRKSLRSFGTVLRRFVALVPVLIAVTTLPIALLALFNAGFVTALEIVVTGWLLLTPVAVLLTWVVLGLSPVDLPWSLADREVELPGVASDSVDFGPASATGADADGDDPVEVLRERFARGEIDQHEFEQRLDQLLATEDGSPGGRRADSARDGSAGRRDTADPTASDRRSQSGGERSADRGSTVRRDREPESS